MVGVTPGARVAVGLGVGVWAGIGLMVGTIAPALPALAGGSRLCQLTGRDDHHRDAFGPGHEDRRRAAGFAVDAGPEHQGTYAAGVR